MKARFLFVLLAAVLWFGCTRYDDYFLVGSRQEKAEQRKLITALDADSGSPENRFIINNQIINAFLEHGETEKMNLFLTAYVKTHPEDSFNAYYLLLVAENYRASEAYPFAAYYYERVLKNYRDLLLEGNQSIHYICLINLVRMVEEPEIRVNYHKELLERFGESIEKGAIYYSLAQTYEELGKWDLAMQHYKEYLKYPGTVIQGVPNARLEVTLMVSLYDLPRKNWTMENLEDLVQRIRNAIWRKDTRVLNALRAGVDFFVRAWEDEDSEQELELLNDLGVFLQQGRILSSSTLDRDSNEREAYLRTSGWGYRIKTWYLYFRKVYFPPDPDIHGQWEWAGIYLGEKPY